MNSKSSDGASFVSLGKWDFIESEHILKRFEEEGVRFRIHEDDSPLRNMSPLRASFGGDFGTGRFIEIFTCQDDAEKVKTVMSKLFPV